MSLIHLKLQQAALLRCNVASIEISCFLNPSVFMQNGKGSLVFAATVFALFSSAVAQPASVSNEGALCCSSFCKLTCSPTVVYSSLAGISLLTSP